MKPSFLCLPCLLAQPLVGQQAFTLPNHLQALLQSNPDRPYLGLSLEIRWPMGEEPPGREGASSLLVRVLGAGGAGPYDQVSLDRLLEERGIAYELKYGPGILRWELRCTSALQEEAFALLAHLVARPVCTGSVLEAQRARLWREHQAMGLAEWAERRFRWELLEGRPESLGSESSLSRLSLDDLSTLQRRLIRPERAVLRIHGDLNLAQARQLALLHLGVWGPQAVPPLPAAPEAKPRNSAPPACLAVAQGVPAATLALVLPADSRQDLAELLAELLPRWLEALPGDLPGATASVQRLADDRPCVILKAPGGKRTPPADVLQQLRGWVDRLANRALLAEDLRIAERLCASRKAARAGGLSTAGTASPSPARLEDLSALLRAWCSAPQQRALLAGVLDIPQDHPALKVLGSVKWVRGKD